MNPVELLLLGATWQFFQLPPWGLRPETLRAAALLICIGEEGGGVAAWPASRHDGDVAKGMGSKRTVVWGRRR